MTSRKSRVTNKKDTSTAPSRRPGGRNDKWSSVEIPTEIWSRITEDAKKQFLKPSQLVRQILAKHYGMVPAPDGAPTAT